MGFIQIVEYLKEQLDSKKYLDELALDGTLSEVEYDHAFKLHFELWWWMNGVRARMT